MAPVLLWLQLGERAVPIGGYGVMLCLGLAVGCGLALRAASRDGFELGALVSVLGWAVGGGFVGGALLHALVRWASTGSLAAAVAAPGLAFFGAAFGGFCALALSCRRMGLALARLLDLAVPALAAGHALGRIGCLLGGCCFGAPTDFPLALRYKDPLAPASALSAPLHPVPLYEALGLAALALGFALRRPARVGRGRRIAAYVALYALLRLFLEGLRGDTVRGVFFGVSTGRWLALLSLVGAALYLLRSRRPGRSLPVAASLVVACAQLIAALLGVLPGVAVADRAVQLRPTLPAMVRIQGGWFSMGSGDEDLAYAEGLCERETEGRAPCDRERFAHEQPRHRVFLNGYAIDRTEVSNAAYRRCVFAGVCRPARTAEHDTRLGQPRMPVASVTFEEARRYCAWVGGQLPSEAQWEYAARGASRRRFPWGRYYNSRVANHGPEAVAESELDGFRFAAPVGAFVDGRSAHGVLDMAGNVWEITRDRYDADAYARPQHVDPLGPDEGHERVIRGGSWRSLAYELRVTHRTSMPETESRPDVGFRCAYNVP